MRHEVLDAVAGRGRWSAGFTGAAVILVVLLLQDHEAARGFPLFLTVLAGIGALGRFGLAALFERAERAERALPQGVDHSALWERAFLVMAATESTFWSLLGWAAGAGDTELRLIVTGPVLLVAWLQFITYAPSRRLGSLAFVPILVGTAIGQWWWGGADGRIFGAFLVLFAVGGVVTQWRLAGQHRQNLFSRLVQEAFAAEQRTLLDTLTVGVLVTRRHVIVDCNETFLRMFGYTRRALIGRSVVTGAHVDNAQSLPAEWPQTLGRHSLRRKTDGRVLEVEVSVGEVEPGHPDTLTVCVYDDVTEKLHFERELRLSRERLRLALDALQSGVWDVDLDQDRMFFSRRFKALLGFDEGTRLAWPEARLFFHHEFVHPADREAVAQARMAMLLEGAPLDIQYRIVRDDTTVWLRETALALKDETGTPVRFTGSLTDTSSINAIQERLAASEEFHRSLIDASSAVIWRTDRHGILTFVNERAALDLYGVSASELVGRSYEELIAPESKERGALEALAGLGQGLPVRHVEMVHLTAGSRRLFVSINAVPVLNDDGVFDGAIGITSDITHLKKRERLFQDATRLQRLIFDSAGEGIVLVRNGRLYRANQAFADLVGATLGEVVARPLSRWFADEAGWEEIEARLARYQHPIKVEVQMRHSSGSTLWASVTGRYAEQDEQAKVYIWVFADISASKAQEEQSWHRANHDELTGLPNRRLLHDRLEQALAQARRESRQIALLMLDLDGFKEVNDAFGHRAGDAVLKTLAQRLGAHLRAQDTVARLGGDEFVVLLQQVATHADIEQAARRLIDTVFEPIEIDGRRVRVGASIGIAVFPDASDNINGLVHAADMAMYEAKSAGKGQFRFAPRRDDAVESVGS